VKRASSTFANERCDAGTYDDRDGTALGELRGLHGEAAIAVDDDAAQRLALDYDLPDGAAEVAC
jgi:hypothetical protein